MDTEESATPASEDDVETQHPSGRPFMFHERMKLYKLQNPQAESYWIHTQSTASAFLLVLSATLKNMYLEMNHGEARRAMKAQATQYRHAVTRGNALDVLRNLVTVEPLEIYGMWIRVPTAERCAKWPAGTPYMPLKGE